MSPRWGSKTVFSRSPLPRADRPGLSGCRPYGPRNPSDGPGLWILTASGRIVGQKTIGSTGLQEQYPMTTIAHPPATWTLPPGLVPYTLPVHQYEPMVDAGIFTKRDRLELIEGLLVAKMTKKPDHSVGS